MNMNEAGRERLLLVDDEKHLLIALRDYLVYEKFDVVIAESGEEALGHLEKGVQPDLIILDISMPGMGGLGFVRRITDEEGRIKYPILVLTARSKMEEFFKTVNVDGFLAKPCDEAKLVRKIREILATRKPSPERQGRARKMILLAEDDRGDVHALTTALEAAGYDVDVVGKGPAVLEQAPITMPDLILMKEILPCLNGSAVASLAGVMPSLATVPVVIYDETLSEIEGLPARYTNAKCIKRVLRSSQASVLVQAVQELLKR